MTDRSSKITELTALTTPAGSDLLVIVDDPTGTPVTKKITIDSLFGNLTSNVSFSNTTVLSANALVLRGSNTPGNSSPSITKGAIFFDENFIYVATANNTLKRVALSAF
jgi:hypothetical protein